MSILRNIVEEFPYEITTYDQTSYKEGFGNWYKIGLMRTLLSINFILLSFKLPIPIASITFLLFGVLFPFIPIIIRSEYKFSSFFWAYYIFFSFISGILYIHVETINLWIFLILLSTPVVLTTLLTFWTETPLCQNGCNKSAPKFRVES